MGVGSGEGQRPLPSQKTPDYTIKQRTTSSVPRHYGNQELQRQRVRRQRNFENCKNSNKMSN